MKAAGLDWMFVSVLSLHVNLPITINIVLEVCYFHNSIPDRTDLAKLKITPLPAKFPPENAKAMWNKFMVLVQCSTASASSSTDSTDIDQSGKNDASYDVVDHDG